MKRLKFVNVLVMALLVVAMLGFSTGRASAGGPFIVTLVADGNDATPGDGLCATTYGSCTLRAAIQESNAFPGANSIAFSLPGGGVHSLSITIGPLPVITDTLTLDGTSEPNCIAPCLVLSGANIAGVNSGLVLQSDYNIIKGFIITSWGVDGIGIHSDGNTIQKNDIGFWPDDPASLPNGYGIEIDGANNLVGGSGAAARNVISGNRYEGITIARSGGSYAGNRIQGNYIGTNAVGNAALPNGRAGIFINYTASNTLIGGSGIGVRNVISGNAASGITSSAPGTRIQGNYIGTSAAGTAALGNGNDGIFIADANIIVGGGLAYTSNVIAYNHRNGITVIGATTRANLRRNSIYLNAGLGIDLGDNGVTLNDLLDPDTGPNGLQNFPIISSATAATSAIAVTIRSLADQTYRLDLYSSPAGTCDLNHYGEGRKWLGTVTVTTNLNGVWNGSMTTAYPFLAGQVIAGTATDGAGRTSEFSACRIAG